MTGAGRSHGRPMSIESMVINEAVTVEFSWRHHSFLPALVTEQVGVTI